MKLTRPRKTDFVSKTLRKRPSRWILLGASLALAASMQGHAQSTAAPPSGPAPSPEDASVPVPIVRPNYELAARFMPDRISKLIFDTSVTPHWLETSDKFWYSYQTTSGTRYWIVDPLKHTKVPLWDNAKVAAALREGDRESCGRRSAY